MSEAAPQPFSAEMRNDVDPTWLIGMLHFHEYNASILQSELAESHRKARQPLRAAHYLIHHPFDNSPHIPAPHNRIILGPHKDGETEHGIARINVRLPANLSDVFPQRPEEQPWNDVFLEIYDEEGRSQDYLLNSKGIFPFNDVNTEVADAEDYAVSGNLFMVVDPIEPRIKVSLAQLQDLIPPDLSAPTAYIYQLQTNDTEQPYIPN